MATKKSQVIDQAQPEAGAASVAGGSRAYITDVYTWANEQVKAMQKRDYDKVDWENVIEEIAEMATNREGQWVSNCARAVQHMHKILSWPTRLPRPERTVGKWHGEIDVGKKPYRQRMEAAIRDNPGLKKEIEGMAEKAWDDGCWAAAEDFATAELGRDHPDWWSRVQEIREEMPERCPWTLVELAGYNPREKVTRARRHPDLWPPEVAKVLNRLLKKNYPECGWDAEYENGPAVRKDELAKLEQGGDWKERKSKRGKKGGRAHQSMLELAREEQAREREQGRSR